MTRNKSPVSQGVTTMSESINMDSFKAIIDQLRGDIKQDIDDAFTKCNARMDKAEASCQAKYEEVKVDVATLEAENKRLNQVIESQDQEARKKNIVFFQIREIEKERNMSTEELVREMCSTLGVHIGPDGIVEAFRLGRVVDARPILVKLTSFEMKKKIMFCNRQSENSFIIMNDLSKKEREFRQEMKPFIMAEKEKGKKVFVRGTKIFIDGHECNKDQMIQRHSAAATSVELLQKGETNASRGGNTSNRNVAVPNQPLIPARSETPRALTVVAGPSGAYTNRQPCPPPTPATRRTAASYLRRAPEDGNRADHQQTGMDWMQSGRNRRRPASNTSDVTAQSGEKDLAGTMKKNYAAAVLSVPAPKRGKVAGM